MSNTPTHTMSPPEEPEQVKTAGRQREETIRAGVLAARGRPPRLFRVAVLPVGGSNYRVNVVTGEDAAAVAIPNSYFVTADERGVIPVLLPSWICLTSSGLAG